ncbi:MAG: hypothetical protein NWF05_08945 [Candidatus Bathyarchaeota archaeon]|nr:hypothetical protein [Candidatus Bathyarchaeota archaeon]
MISIECYRNQDLADEVERREQNGSRILSCFTGMSFKVTTGSTEYLSNLRRGSKRWLMLRFHFSDKQLIEELLRRLSDGDGDLLNMLKVVQNRQTLRVLDEAIRKCGEKKP